MRGAVMMSGACGTSVGAHQGGVKVVWAANHNPAAIDMHEANFPPAECESVCQDLHLFNHAKMAKHDILLASPVCRVNSSASRPARAKAAEAAKANDPAKRKQGAALASSHNSMGALPWAVMDALEVNRPRHFVIENVTEWADEWPLYDLYLRMLRRLGYKVTQQRLNARAYGVPQDRLRLFVIGTLDRRAIHAREPKQWEPAAMHDCVDWDAGEWLEFDEANGPKMREQLTQAHYILGRHPGFIQLVGHRPVYPSTRHINAMTTQDQYRWVYRGRFRYPTPRECYRLMGFPESFVIPPRIEADRTVASAMAGDAVCPPVMRAISEQIVKVAA